MRVLVISHNMFSCTSNMGKTLTSYFSNFCVDDVAQFSIHTEVPTDDSVCVNYYRFTDSDAFHSVFSGNYKGKRFGKADICKDRVSEREDTGKIAEIYQFGRKRKAYIYVARNIMWAISRWKNCAFRAWLKDVNPDVIFFAAGDYKFMYDIVLWVANILDCPLVVCCMDDFYLHNKNRNSLLGRIEHRFFMKSVHKTMKRASSIFTICDTMGIEYKKLFRRPCHTLHTSALSKDLRYLPEASRISYIGNLGYKRDEQLVAIGKALKRISTPDNKYVLDVYSSETRENVLKNLTFENGICFHGMISADEVLHVMENSVAVIHTESFNEDVRISVRFSVSTKIAESLMYGPCLIAYGPEGIASIDYLQQEQAAFVISAPEQLDERLKIILNDTELRKQIVHNARTVANRNHNAQTNPQQVKLWLSQAVRDFSRDDLKGVTTK